MKVIVYIRVSTARQVEEGLGLVDQERACRAWARQHGHQVLAVVRDEGVSGTTELKHRLGLAEVWRSGELLSTAGGEANLHDDPEDPSRRLIRQVLGAVSEYERAMIALRLRRGRAATAARGGFAYGSPAFGHRAAGRPLVPGGPDGAGLGRRPRRRGSWPSPPARDRPARGRTGASRPYVALQSMPDGGPPHGRHYYWRSHRIHGLPGQVPGYSWTGGRRSPRPSPRSAAGP